MRNVLKTTILLAALAALLIAALRKAQPKDSRLMISVGVADPSPWLRS